MRDLVDFESPFLLGEVAEHDRETPFLSEAPWRQRARIGAVARLPLKRSRVTREVDRDELSPEAEEDVYIAGSEADELNELEELDAGDPWLKAELEDEPPFVAGEAGYDAEAEEDPHLESGDEHEAGTCGCGSNCATCREANELDGEHFEGEGDLELEDDLEFEHDASIVRAMEAGVVRGLIASGQRDEVELTDTVFFMRHPELPKNKRLTAGQEQLMEEWRRIRHELVRPALGAVGAASTPLSGQAKLAIRRRDSAVPGFRGTFGQLVESWRQKICPEIPLSLLLAFSATESSGYGDATHGKGPEYRSPSFYEIGVFQTPAGLHGACTGPTARDGSVPCEHAPPGKDWASATWGKQIAVANKTLGLHLDGLNWKDPTTQIVVGLLDLSKGGKGRRARFKELFPTPGTDWDLRAAVLLSFSRGGGYADAFLKRYRRELLALDESERWDFLRGKTTAYTDPRSGKTRTLAFFPDNVDKKVQLAAELGYGAGRSTTSAQAPTAPAPIQPKPKPSPPSAPVSSPTQGESASSPLAVPSPYGPNLRGGKRKQPIFGIIVHTTGSGLVSKAKASKGRRTAIDVGLKYYAHGLSPHYVIDFDGTIYATCPEDHVASHAGWLGIGGRARWKGFTAPTWWTDVWGVGKTPLDLLPSHAAGPNNAHIGVELVGNDTDRHFTDAQYRALGDLVADIDRRYQLGISSAPSTKLLGHEDVTPLTKAQAKEGHRADAKGGWDPGAHRADSRFSWPRLWQEVERARGGATASELDELFYEELDDAI